MIYTKLSYNERISQKLLANIPKAKPFGKLVNGKFITGTKSLHRTKQGVAFNRFLRLISK